MMILRSSLYAVVLCSLCLAACSSNPDRDSKRAQKDKDKKETTQLSETELRQEADKLYRDARKSLDSASYSEAITKYDKLIARYPFSDYGTQGEMERLFAQYKSYQSDEASSAADRFLRDHPRHPKADYVQYLKGLIDFDRNNSFLNYLPVDSSRADVSSERLAFNDFALLVQKYPSSPYVGDARKRMIFLRDRIAQHEISVVRYYQRRGAYLAAAKRAEAIIADFPGAPATATALELMKQSYAAIGLNQEADEAGKLIAANPGLTKPSQETVTPTRVLLAAPSAAPATLAAPTAATENQTIQTHGFFSWFAGLFSRFDTTRPENTYTVTIPTGNAKPTNDATTATPGVASAPATDASTSTTPTKSTHGLHFSIGPSDDAEPTDAAKAAATATPPAATSPAAGVSTPQAAQPQPASAPAAPPTPSPTTPPPETAAPKKGILSRVADGIKSIFSRDAESVDAPSK